MEKIKSKSIWMITAGAFFSTFVFGFSDNLKGATIPVILKNLHLSYSLGGLILLGAYIGFFLATLVTGVLADLAGNKPVLYVAGLALLFGIAAYSISNTPFFLLASMVLLGFGLGSIEVGGNNIIVDIHNGNKGKYLSLLAFFHSLGSALAPLYAGQLLISGLSWREVYRYNLLLVVIFPLYFLFVKYPKERPSKRDKIDLKVLSKSAFTLPLLLFYVIILAYVASELGIASWLVEFLQSTKSQSVILSSIFLSAYFASLMLGRLIGSFIIDKVGYVRIMLIATIASVICIISGIWGPSAYAFLLPVTGFCFSIVFPAVTAAVSELHTGNVGTVLGLLFSFAGIGGMVGPWTVGVFSDMYGIKWGLSFVAGFCLLMLICQVILLTSAFISGFKISELAKEDLK